MIVNNFKSVRVFQLKKETEAECIKTLPNEYNFGQKIKWLMLPKRCNSHYFHVRNSVLMTEKAY